MRASRPAAIVVLAFLVAGAASFRSVSGVPFVPPKLKPETLWEGMAPGHPQGVLVIRNRVEWGRVTAGLDPAYAGTLPDFGHERVLLVVGRERENPCRDTVLREVRAQGVAARVAIEERVPPADCSCPGAVLPPRAWLVRVPRTVTRASREITDVVVPCATGRQAADRAASRPVLLAEGSWDEMPGARLLTSRDEFAATAKRLGRELPALDPARTRLVVITGRPRSNGCRRTRVVEARVDGNVARFVLEERYPGRGEMCPAVFMLPAAFVYRVPASVERAEVETREVRGAPRR